MANMPSKLNKIDSTLKEIGESVGDPYELSSLRREDYESVKGNQDYEDLIQCKNVPIASNHRGHQLAGAFLIMGSGLEKVFCSRFY
jgi:leucyl aminopeptidase